MQIRNVTEDILGWDGMELAPGGIVEVPDQVGVLMVGSHPAKFEEVEESDTPEPPTADGEKATDEEPGDADTQPD